MSSTPPGASGSSSRRRSRSRSASPPRSSTAAAASSERDRERDRGKRSRSRDRSTRSRSRSRSRDRDRKHDKHRSKHSRRSRSRSRSDSRERSRKESKKDRKEGKDKDKDKKSDKESSRELERALKKAHKALKHGNSVEGLDSALLDQLLAEQKAKAAAKEEKKKNSKRSKDKRKGRDSSDSDSDTGSSSSSSDDDANTPAFLSDGVTPRLSKRDYFARSTEFRVWLHEVHGRHVDDIPSGESRKKFAQFVQAWNKKSLPEKYYKGMDNTSLSASSLTKHKWAFAQRMTETEKLSLASTRDSIDTSTHHHTFQEEFLGQRAPPGSQRTAVGPQAAAAAASVGRSAGAPANSAARESTEERESRIKRERADNKRYASHASMVLEELVPKATGREAMLEKRAQKGSYARADGDAGGIDAGMSERDMLGSGGKGEYQEMLAKRQQAAARKESETSTKLSEHAQREREKMQKMLASIGMADKYPMQ